MAARKRKGPATAGPSPNRRGLRPGAKMSKREIKELAEAYVNALVAEVKVTQTGGLSFSMTLPAVPKKAARRRSKKKATRHG